jgi:hypothetical protein
MNTGGPPVPSAGPGAPQIDTTTELKLMVASGVESIRVAVSWAGAQPYPSFAAVPSIDRTPYANVGGIPTNFSSLDSVMTTASTYGLTVLPNVEFTPDWAKKPPIQYGSPPKSVATYARFMAALVRRYGPRGTFWQTHPALRPEPIRAWQIWNEPDICYWWNAPIRGNYCLFQASYAKLLKAAHDAIKAVDRHAEVVLGSLVGDAWNQLPALYRIRGVRKWFDALSYDDYTQLSTHAIEFLQLVRAAMNRHGDRSKPIIESEVGCPSAVGQGAVHGGAGIICTERQQAIDASQELLVAGRDRRKLGLQSVYYYFWIGWEHPGADYFNFSGLRRVDSSGHVASKPSLGAFQRAALLIEGCARKASVAPRCAVRTRHSVRLPGNLPAVGRASAAADTAALGSSFAPPIISP